MNPSTWDNTSTIAVSWVQSGFAGSDLGPAVIQINTATDGSASGTWVDRHQVPEPLVDGSNGMLNLPVGDLEGRHLVRVVVAGAAGSPLQLGELRLDRSPPRPTGVAIATDVAGDVATVAFVLDDNGMAGVDPIAPVTVEYLVAGVWTPTGAQPGPGAGAKMVRIDTARLAEGPYPIRVTSRDVLGNAGAVPVGVLNVDRQPPVANQLRVTRAPTTADPTAEIRFTSLDPEPGSGLDPSVPTRAIDTATGAVIGTTANVAGESAMTVSLPGPGTHSVAVEVTDRAGRVGRSAPLQITVPFAPGPPPPSSQARSAVDRVELLTVRSAGRTATPAARWAFAAARRFHAQRGVTLNTALATAQTSAEWATLLGTPAAGQLDGYATFGGVVALGPAPTRGLDVLNRRRQCIRLCPRTSRADADRMVGAIAVLLHETIHATGASALADYQDTASGRAFEEAFAEAATVDLLPAFVRSLPVRSGLRRDLSTAVRRYRPHYPAQLNWARDLSARATGASPDSDTARRWRIGVADTWGADRWTLLAASTGRAEPDLRDSAPTLAHTINR